MPSIQDNDEAVLIERFEFRDQQLESSLSFVNLNGSMSITPPFIEIGTVIKKGQVIGIIEAMKLMNEIESEYDGVVEEILVKNGQNVDYGQPLFIIKEFAD